MGSGSRKASTTVESTGRKASRMMDGHAISYEISYRRIKHPRLEFKTGNLLLVLPHGCDPEHLLHRHKAWILERSRFIEQCLHDSLDKKIVARSDAEFAKFIGELAERVSTKLGIGPNNVYLRKMTSKWGSCSSRRNLTINTLLKHVPDHLVEYVVCHELVHLKERRHNDRFWQFVSRSFRNYHELERDLFVYWFCLARKFPDDVRTATLPSRPLTQTSLQGTEIHVPALASTDAIQGPTRYDPAPCVRSGSQRELLYSLGGSKRRKSHVL